MSFDLILVGKISWFVKDYPCTRFGDSSFNRFGFIVQKVNERIESVSHTRFSLLLNLLITWSLFSLLAALFRHLSISSPSLVRFQYCHLPVTKTQIAHSGIMHYPVFGIIVRLHSVNLIHHLSPPSQHPSLPLSSTPDLKHTCSTNHSHHRSSSTHRTAHWTSNCFHGLRTAQRLFYFFIVIFF